LIHRLYLQLFLLKIMIEFDLSQFEARVLGVLAEKQFITPDIYPLSLNALTNGCNQLSNRDPVMALTDDTVLQALQRLQQRKLVQVYYPAGSRVAKYQHMLAEVFAVDDARLSALTMLLLRGPQTCGELRSRTGRMHDFSNVDAVERSLNDLADASQALVIELPRAPGTKEARWAHLLCGEIAIERQEMAASMMGHNVGGGMVNSSLSDERVNQLEADVSQLKREMAWLTEELLKFKKQFE
jgi:uncharacterized protein